MAMVSGQLVASASHLNPSGKNGGLPQCSSISTLINAVSAARWVGQGAQGAVLQGTWRSGCTVAVKWIVADGVNASAAYMEAFVAKMLAHPYVVQTFEFAVAPLDEDWVVEPCVPVGGTFRAGVPQVCHLLELPTDYSTEGNVMCARGSLPSSQLLSQQHAVDGAMEQLAALSATDSFVGQRDERLSPGRAVDCVDVLRQLGAAPGKYVVQIVSEWCDEGTLHTAMRRGVFRPSRARSAAWALRALLRTAREVALGMCHLHSLDIIHADLKPGNILLKSSRVDSRGFVAKVADFGLSRMCCGRPDGVVPTSDYATVHYMAPEYLDNRLLKASDVWSFGVLLWELYTGQTPFGGYLEAQVAAGVMFGELQLEWPANAPPPLVRLGQACCAFEPERRPSFQEAVVALVALEVQVRQERHCIKCRSAAVGAHGVPQALRARAMSALAPGPTLPAAAADVFAAAADGLDRPMLGPRHPRPHHGSSCVGMLSASEDAQHLMPLSSALGDASTPDSGSLGDISILRGTQRLRTEPLLGDGSVGAAERGAGPGWLAPQQAFLLPRPGNTAATGPV